MPDPAALTGLVLTDPDARPFHGRIGFEDNRIASIRPLDSPSSDPRFIVPGLIDSHTHPLELGLKRLFTSLETATSIADVLARLQDGIETGRASGVLFGLNLNPDQLAEHRYPHRTELDSIESNVPMLVYRVDGHSAVVNTAGLELVQSDLLVHPANGLDPETGVLRGRAYEQASRRFKRLLAPDTIHRALHLAAQAAAEQGVTTIGALVGTDDLDETGWRGILDSLADMEVHAVPFLQTRNVNMVHRFGLPRIGGCLLVDGSFGSHTAALSHDYSDAPDNNGICYFDDDELSVFIQQAHTNDLQTAVHAIGDRAVDQVVRCHERIKPEADMNPLRHRIEHAELLDPDLVRRIANLGLVLGIQPAFEARWGGPERLYARRLGSRWRRTNPWRDLLDAGVVLAGGSDAPITPINPLAGIRAATGHPNQEQRVKGSEALAMFTTAAAYSLGIDQKTGRLAPGMTADVTVLSDDPRTAPDCRVLETWCGGRCLYRRNEEARSRP